MQWATIACDIDPFWEEYRKRAAEWEATREPEMRKRMVELISFLKNQHIPFDDYTLEEQ